MIRALALMLGLLVAAPITAQLSAHQQKTAISTVAANARTDRLEVVHQVPVHDAEHALKRQGIAADIVGSAASREDFARYVARRFLLTADGKPVGLDYVGSEVSGGSLMVYQEASLPSADAQLQVNSQILTDIWARQENRVNIGHTTSVRTFIFTDGAADRSFVL